MNRIGSRRRAWITRLGDGAGSAFTSAAKACCQIIRSATERVSQREMEIGERGPQRPVKCEPPRGGDNRRTQRDEQPFATHPAREVQILEQREFTETIQRFKYLPPHEDRLVAEKPAGKPRPGLRKQARRAQKKRTRIIPAGKASADDARVLQGGFDPIQRGRCEPGIGMEKKKDVAPRLLRAGIHLHRPVPPDFMLHARPFFAREFTGAVATPGIHDQNFMRCMAPRNRLQRGWQMARLVVGRDDD